MLVVHVRYTSVVVHVRYTIFRQLTKKLEFTNMKECNRPSKTRINFSFYVS